MKSKERENYFVFLSCSLTIICSAIMFLLAPPMVVMAQVDLPKTGLSDCYNASGTPIPCLFTGQDGDIRAGVTWPVPRFTNPDGTVPVSGEVILDRLTGLMWLRDGNCWNRYATDGRGGRLVGWQHALDFVKGINDRTYPLCGAGFTDWRLPNINELESLVSLGQLSMDTWLMAQGFQNVQNDSYYSSTSGLWPDTTGAYTLSMLNGDIGGISKATSNFYGFLFVLPVRSGQTGTPDSAYPANVWQTGQTGCYSSGLPGDRPCPGTGEDGEHQRGVSLPSPRFTVTYCDTNGPCTNQGADCDGDESTDMVTDNLTGLVWARSANLSSGTVNWQQALNFANGLTLCGQSDWRLSNRKELRSLNHFQAVPALPPGHPFVGVQNLNYWTSDTSMWSGSSAQFVTMLGGNTGYSSKSSSLYYAWPVRGGTIVDHSLYVNVFGSKFFFAGQEVSYAVEYSNQLKVDAQNVVVQVSLPKEVTFISASPGGIYRKSNHEVFWRLGTVPIGTSGLTNVTVRYRWGIPEGSHFQIVGAIDASNAPAHVFPNLDSYLSYLPVDITSQRKLSSLEIESLLSASPDLSSLRQQALEMGFADHGIASETIRSDGSLNTTISLIKLNPFEVLLLRHGLLNSNRVVYAERFNNASRTYTLYDVQGGLTEDLMSGITEGWGGWAEITTTVASMDTSVNANACEKTKKKCIDGCLKENGHTGGIQDYYQFINEVALGYFCTQCLNSDDPESVECRNCILAILDGEDWVYQECFEDCNRNYSSHMCQQDWYTCEGVGDLIGWRKFIEPYGARYRVRFRCNPDTCQYDPPQLVQCGFCSECSNGECYGGIDGWIPFIYDCNDTEANVARDPNAKSGFFGDVVPNQTLSYTIDYENVGQGEAYGVFILDKLDQHLDENTLSNISNGGTYSTSTRSIGWDIGTLAPQGQPGSKGSVSFDVHVKSGLSSGTEIMNYATVYFPSVPEITPTNSIVNRVHAITAHPQSLDAVSGTPLPVTLMGMDAGGGTLTYRITSAPLHGEVTGLPPNISYLSMAGYNGPDKFSFVVNNGSVDSASAEVSLSVKPSQTDTTPPTVTATYPSSGATGIPVSLTPITQNAYTPVISAQFSEPVNPATINASSFSVSGLTGTVSYDASTFTAYFISSTPLIHSTEYTVRVSGNIVDNAGNPMGTDHVWQFTTNPQVDIRVTLPPTSNGSLDFGNVALGMISSPQTFTVSSAGSANLTIGTITLSGASAVHFAVQQDNCSGQTLLPGHSCPVTLTFNPIEGGRKSANLSIPSNDPDENMVQFILTGLGILSNGGYADPSEGTSGTEFVLTGSNFGSSAGKILLGKKKCSIIGWTNSSITARIGKISASGTYNIMVYPKEPKKATPIGLANALKIMNPQLASGPWSGNHDQAVTLQGLYFGMPSKGKVYLEYSDNGRKKRKSCKVTGWTMNPTTGASSATFFVPKLPKGVYDLTLSNKVGSSTLVLGFTIQ